MRKAMEIATLGCSVNVRLSRDKKSFRDIRIAYGVAGPVPLRASYAERFGKEQPVTMETVEKVSRAVLEDVHPRDSWRASKDFRSHLCVTMAKEALLEASRLAGGIINE